MTNSYPISNDGASTISSLSSGSGRRAAYRSLVHFLPSLLPMPPPPPPQSTPPMQQHSNQAAATGNSLHDLNVSGISYQSSQTGGTARRSLHGSGDGTHADGNRPTPVRSRSRPRDQVGVDPDGPPAAAGRRCGAAMRRIPVTMAMPRESRREGLNTTTITGTTIPTTARRLDHW